MHPGAPDRDPRRRQAAPHLRERARRRRARLGPEGREGQAHPARHPREASATTSSSACTPGYGNLVPRDIASREHLPARASTRGAASTTTRPARTRTRSTSTSRTRTRTFLRKKLAGILEIYEKFVGVDPVQEPDEDLPRRPLLDGRPVGRLRERRATARSSSARRATRRRTSRASTRRARSTTSTTAPTASAPTRCSRASTAAWSRARRWRRYVKNLGDERVRPARARSSRRPRSASATATSASSRRIRTENAENPYVLHDELGEIMLRDCTIERDNDDARQGDREDRRARRARARRRRHRHVAAREPGRAVRAAPREHARPRARHRAGRAEPRRVARRALQAGLPQARRRELAAHHAGAATRTEGSGRSSCASSTTRCAGKSVHVTDEVDISLVKPRERKYEQAGAASAAPRQVDRRARARRDADHGQTRQDRSCRQARPPQDPAAGRPRQPETRALGRVRGPLPAADERHQRADGDPEGTR